MEKMTEPLHRFLISNFNVVSRGMKVVPGLPAGLGMLLARDVAHAPGTTRLRPLVGAASGVAGSLMPAICCFSSPISAVISPRSSSETVSAARRASSAVIFSCTSVFSSADNALSSFSSEMISCPKLMSDSRSFLAA
jgi:hypothetical protein